MPKLWNCISLIFAMVAVTSCDGTTTPDSPLAGQYELRSINGDTVLSISNPDGSVTSYYGLIILRNDATYSYAVMTRACRGDFDCTPMAVKTLGGIWWDNGGSIDLSETADGTLRHWNYSSAGLSGDEPKFFNGSRRLLFRHCMSDQFNFCSFTPGY